MNVYSIKETLRTFLRNLLKGTRFIKRLKRLDAIKRRVEHKDLILSLFQNLVNEDRVIRERNALVRVFNRVKYFWIKPLKIIDKGK